MPGRAQRWRWSRSRRGAWFLEPTLLLLLHHDPAHGYTLIEQLSKFGLGDVDAGAVYRMLRGMEAKGWITSTWDAERARGPPRRVYRLTVLGNEVLGTCMQDLQGTRRGIDDLVDAYSRHMEKGEGEYHG